MSFEESILLELMRAVRMRISRLGDIIEAKRAAGRSKDLASLPILEEFLRVQAAVEDE